MRRSALLLTVALVTPALALAGFKASSQRKDAHGEHYDIKSALDANTKTAWHINPESEQVGEWFEIGVPKSSVTGLRIINGWTKTEQTFTDYGRIKSMRIEVFSEGDEGMAKVAEKNVKLEDTQGWQEFELPEAAVGTEFTGGKVRMTITEIYPGEDYPSVAVSEVLVLLKEQNSSATIKSDSGSHDTYGVDRMLDGKTSTYWVSSAAEDVSFTLGGADGWGLSTIGIQAGPTSYHRPKKLKITVDDTNSVTVDMTNDNTLQSFHLPAIMGYSGSAWGDVEVQVLETYPGKGDGVGIAEVKLMATTYEGI